MGSVGGRAALQVDSREDLVSSPPASGPASNVDDVVRAERKAGRPSLCPWHGGQGGGTWNRKVQGVGPGPCGREMSRVGGSWPSLPSLLSEPFAQTVHLMMSSPRCREATWPTVVASAAGRGSQTLLGAQGSPPPRAQSFSSLCLESAQGEFVSDAGPLFTATPPQHHLGPSPHHRTLDSPLAQPFYSKSIEDHFIDSGKRERSTVKAENLEM